MQRAKRVFRKRIAHADLLRAQRQVKFCSISARAASTRKNVEDQFAGDGLYRWRFARETLPPIALAINRGRIALVMLSLLRAAASALLYFTRTLPVCVHCR